MTGNIIFLRHNHSIEEASRFYSFLFWLKKKNTQRIYFFCHQGKYQLGGFFDSLFKHRKYYLMAKNVILYQILKFTIIIKLSISKGVLKLILPLSKIQHVYPSVLCCKI